MKPVEIVEFPHPQMTVTSPRSASSRTRANSRSRSRSQSPRPSRQWKFHHVHEQETESSSTISRLPTSASALNPSTQGIPQIPSSPLASSLSIPENIPHYSLHTTTSTAQSSILTPIRPRSHLIPLLTVPITNTSRTFLFICPASDPDNYAFASNADVRYAIWTTVNDPVNNVPLISDMSNAMPRSGRLRFVFPVHRPNSSRSQLKLWICSLMIQRALPVPGRTATSSITTSRSVRARRNRSSMRSWSSLRRAGVGCQIRTTQRDPPGSSGRLKSPQNASCPRLL